MQGEIEIPLIGLGTWELKGAECTRAVTTALKLGYRHIDTAHLYQNHQAIAKALQGYARDQLYITSKFSVEMIDDHNVTHSVIASCDQALKELKTDYLDLYLLHGPDRKRPYLEMVRAMQELIRAGKIRFCGVSNFTIHHLRDMIQKGIKASYNQIELHPYLYQKELISFCNTHHIEPIAFRPLGKGKLVKDPLIKEIASHHNKTSAQILLRWCVEKKVPAVVMSTQPKHQKENLEIFDFSLTKEEIHTLDHMPKVMRLCHPLWDDYDY